MKAIMTTLSIYELRKTLGLWKSRKITDSTISKLLDLYLGVTAYMNDEADYPVENFYAHGQSMKFKNARCLVEAVRQSRSFGIVPDGNVYGMKSFYSYLWKAKDAAESLPETLPEELPEKFPQADIYYYNIYIIYNIILFSISIYDRKLSTKFNLALNQSYHIISINQLLNIEILST